VPIVQLALEAPIGAGPGPNQTDVNADASTVATTGEP